MDEWFVIFRDTDQPRWWNCFLREGFQHVYTLGQLHDDIVLGINPRYEGLEIGLMDGSAHERALMAVQGGQTALRVKAEAPAYQLPRRFCLMTCATVAAYHMGFPVWAPTPWALYRQLVDKFDAEVLTWDC